MTRLRSNLHSPTFFGVPPETRSRDLETTANSTADAVRFAAEFSIDRASSVCLISSWQIRSSGCAGGPGAGKRALIANCLAARAIHKPSALQRMPLFQELLLTRVTNVLLSAELKRRPDRPRPLSSRPASPRGAHCNESRIRGRLEFVAHEFGPAARDASDATYGT